MTEFNIVPQSGDYLKTCFVAKLWEKNLRKPTTCLLTIEKESQLHFFREISEITKVQKTTMVEILLKFNTSSSSLLEFFWIDYIINSVQTNEWHWLRRNIPPKQHELMRSEKISTAKKVISPIQLHWQKFVFNTTSMSQINSCNPNQWIKAL